MLYPMMSFKKYFNMWLKSLIFLYKQPHDLLCVNQIWNKGGKDKFKRHWEVEMNEHGKLLIGRKKQWLMASIFGEPNRSSYHLLGNKGGAL
jgi:hypothetical protein